VSVAIAFRRAIIEHAFRVAKQEAGLMHYVRPAVYRFDPPF